MTALRRNVWITAPVVAAIAAVLVWAAPAVGAGKAAAAKRGAKRPSAAELKQSFEQFCAVWIQKLRDRERANLARMTWEPTPDGLAGTYVGYAAEHSCTLTDDKPPVGKIRYEEVIYEKRGDSIQTATDSTPRPLQRFDTLELFSYIRGKWDY